jgi:hypothetical protein
MPPWRKGRGLGPFTSARPAAGPLLSSQPTRPLTTQNSRSLGDPGHANEHLWRVARPLLVADAVRLPTDVGPATVGHGWPYWVLTATAVAVGQALEGSIDAPTPGPDLGARPAATHIGWESMRRQLSAASPGEPRGRPSGSGVGSGSGGARCRREAAPLPSRGLGSGPEVWRGIRRLLLERGEQAPAVSGTKSSSCLCGGCQATGPPCSPAPQRVRSALPFSAGRS